MSNLAIRIRLPAGLFAIIALCLTVSEAWAGATPGTNVELHIKAAYLFNFGRYVSWPENGHAGNVVIGVLGRDPIVDILEKTVSAKTINGRAYSVRTFLSAEHVDNCDVLFIPRSEARQSQAALAATAGKHILTVSDIENFAGDGGTIGFLLVDDTLKFDITLRAADQAGLKISSELLRVAHDVKGKRR